jgi:hypothetical protein
MMMMITSTAEIDV